MKFDERGEDCNAPNEQEREKLHAMRRLVIPQRAIWALAALYFGLTALSGFGMITTLPANFVGGTMLVAVIAFGLVASRIRRCPRCGASLVGNRYQGPPKSCRRCHLDVTASWQRAPEPSRKRQGAAP